MVQDNKNNISTSIENNILSPQLTKDKRDFLLLIQHKLPGYTKNVELENLIVSVHTLLFILKDLSADLFNTESDLNELALARSEAIESTIDALIDHKVNCSIKQRLFLDIYIRLFYEHINLSTYSERAGFSRRINEMTKHFSLNLRSDSKRMLQSLRDLSEEHYWKLSATLHGNDSISSEQSPADNLEAIFKSNHFATNPTNTYPCLKCLNTSSEIILNWLFIFSHFMPQNHLPFYKVDIYIGILKTNCSFKPIFSSLA